MNGDGEIGNVYAYIMGAARGQKRLRDVGKYRGDGEAMGCGKDGYGVICVGIDAVHGKKE